MTAVTQFISPIEEAPSRATHPIRAYTHKTSVPGQNADLFPDSAPTPNKPNDTQSVPRRVVREEDLPESGCPRLPQWASKLGEGESEAISVHKLSVALRELRDSLREDSYGQEHDQALSTVHPDDLSSRIIAYAEQYESRDDPIPYTLSSEFEHQRDISSISGSTETSTETMVEGIDYQINPCQPLASYPVQEARGGQFNHALGLRCECPTQDGCVSTHKTSSRHLIVVRHKQPSEDDPV